MYSTVYTGHLNATNMTPQQKIHRKKFFKNIKRNKVKICTACNLLGLYTRARAFLNCFKEVALVTVDELFENLTMQNLTMLCPLPGKNGFFT